MSIVATYSKQPDERLDYDVDYAEWIPALDSLLIATVTVSPAGMIVDSPLILTDVVKLWVSGGTSGVRYKVTLTVTTTLGRIKQDEIIFACKEV